MAVRCRGARALRDPACAPATLRNCDEVLEPEASVLQVQSGEEAVTDGGFRSSNGEAPARPCASPSSERSMSRMRDSCGSTSAGNLRTVRGIIVPSTFGEVSFIDSAEAYARCSGGRATRQPPSRNPSRALLRLLDLTSLHDRLPDHRHLAVVIVDVRTGPWPSTVIFRAEGSAWHKLNPHRRGRERTATPKAVGVPAAVDVREAQVLVGGGDDLRDRDRRLVGGTP